MAVLKNTSVCYPAATLGLSTGKTCFVPIKKCKEGIKLSNQPLARINFQTQRSKLPSA